MYTNVHFTCVLGFARVYSPVLIGDREYCRIFATSLNFDNETMKLKSPTAKQLHRWIGIPLCLVLFFSALSGILLNHRELLMGTNVPAYLLPKHYRIENWNNASARGIVGHQGQYYIYGQAGVWQAPRLAKEERSLSANEGLPTGIDERKVVAMQSHQGGLWLATQYALFRREGTSWVEVPSPDRRGSRFVDLHMQGDSLVLMSRSHVFVTDISALPRWQTYELIAPSDYTARVSLFRLVWALHSGEYLGTIGQLVVDAIGIVVMLLSLTGIFYTSIRSYLNQRRGASKEKRRRLAQALGQQYRLHRLLGRWLIVPILFVLVTGWLLRPPLMIPLVMTRLKPWSISHLSSDNPWQDRLRALRYDAYKGEWLLSTTEGFYRLKSWQEMPYRWRIQPSVSPMGINLMHQRGADEWLIGSFSGLFLGNDSLGKIWTYPSMEEVDPSVRTRPTSCLMVSGFISSEGDRVDLFSYDRGAMSISPDKAPMPYTLVEQAPALKDMPYSLWQYALEIHTGRLYEPLIGEWGVGLFIFVLGALSLLVVLTGYWRN